MQPEPPRFIRDNMKIDDVEGARPKIVRELDKRESNKVDDIEGASPKPHKHRKMFGGYNNINYDDVTKNVKKS